MAAYEKVEYNWTSHQPRDAYKGARVLISHCGCHLRNAPHLLPAPTAKTLAMGTPPPHSQVLASQSSVLPKQ